MALRGREAIWEGPRCLSVTSSEEEAEEEGFLSEDGDSATRRKIIFYRRPEIENPDSDLPAAALVEELRDGKVSSGERVESALPAA
jgi:hypothetical protein